jgi:hypothetical protein
MLDSDIFHRTPVATAAPLSSFAFPSRRVVLRIFSVANITPEHSLASPLPNPDIPFILRRVLPVSGGRIA